MKKDWLFKLLFILAILMVGFVYSVLPHFVRYDTLKEQNLRYISLTVNSTFDHINFAAPRYRDVVDGDFIPGEMDTYEHMGGPILTSILVPTVLSPFFFPFDSIFPGMILTDFFFPILLFSALFLILHAFTNEKWFALVSAYVIMLFPQIGVLLPPSSFLELKTLLLQFIPFSGMPASELNFLARDAYIPGGVFFVLMFYFAYRALSGEEKKKLIIHGNLLPISAHQLFIILGGIFYGLLFYLYFFFWIFGTFFLGLLFLFFLFAKERESAKTVFFIVLVGVFVSLPFWINSYNLSQLPWYEDILERQGVEEGHGIRWFLWKTYALHILMAGLALYLSSRFSKKTLGYFLAAIAITGIIAYNVNVFVGWTLQSDHWGNKVFLITNAMVWPPIFYYLWLYITKNIEKREFLKKTISIIAILIVILLSANVAQSGVRESVKNASQYTVDQGLMDAYEWLVENTPKDSVVMTPSIQTNIELAAYTHNRIFQARSQNNLLSREEVLDRWFITYKLFGVPAETFEKTINSKLGVFNFFTAEYNSKALDSSLRPEKYPIYKLPEEVAQNLLIDFSHFGLPEKIPYRLDYLFVGPREKELGINEASLRQHEKLYENNGIVIYKYK